MFQSKYQQTITGKYLASPSVKEKKHKRSTFHQNLRFGQLAAEAISLYLISELSLAIHRRTEGPSTARDYFPFLYRAWTPFQRIAQSCIFLTISYGLSQHEEFTG